MKIAVEGCAHGELEKIYDVVAELEKKQNLKVDLLICCGDFQSTRNLDDLDTMAVPRKHQHICTFYKYEKINLIDIHGLSPFFSNRYYSGEKTAPILTLFIGGNHEASNYLQELPYGGWVAPNIYYLGYASVVQFNGIRIAGLSGIYKAHDYFRGHYEYPPYSESTKRSVYHQRQLEVFRLSQVTPRVDICLSHDWPTGVTDYGNVNQLIRFKPHFREDITNRTLGSKPCEDLLKKLKPKYWFAAHLHCKFSAIIPFEDGTETKFLALDKCLPRRRFLQILEVNEPENNMHKGLYYDLEWLTILAQTNSLLSVKPTNYYMPGPNGVDRYNFQPTDEEKTAIAKKFGNLKVPDNFAKVSHAYDPSTDEMQFGCQPNAQINMQTTIFCDKLDIDDPLSLVMLLEGKELNYSSNVNSSLNSKMTLEENSFKNEPLKSKLQIPVWVDKGNTNPETIDEDERLMKEFNQKYSTPLKHSPENISTSRTKLVLPSPKFEETNVTKVEKQDDKIIESNVDAALRVETPLSKKFKRRNQDIYATPE